MVVALHERRSRELGRNKAVAQELPGRNEGKYCQYYAHASEPVACRSQKLQRPWQGCRVVYADAGRRPACRGFEHRVCQRIARYAEVEDRDRQAYQEQPCEESGHVPYPRSYLGVELSRQLPSRKAGSREQHSGGADHSRYGILPADHGHGKRRQHADAEYQQRVGNDIQDEFPVPVHSVKNHSPIQRQSVYTLFGSQKNLEKSMKNVLSSSLPATITSDSTYVLKPS